MSPAPVFIAVALAVGGCLESKVASTCQDRPRLSAGARLLDLGEVAIGEEAAGEVVLENQGGLPLGIYDLDHAAGYDRGHAGAFAVTCSAADGGTLDLPTWSEPWIVDPGEVTTCAVTFTALHAGRHWDALQLRNGDLDDQAGWADHRTPLLEVYLVGSGAGDGEQGATLHEIGWVEARPSGVEEGGEVTLTWLVHDPEDAFDLGEVSLEDQDGMPHTVEGWSWTWTPDPLEGEERAVVNVGDTLELPDGDLVISTSPVQVWSADAIDAPVCR